MKNKKQFRQGDVLIERVDKVEITKAEKKERGRVILAHGEVTGHAHAIASKTAKKSPYRKETSQGAGITVSELEIQEALADLKHEEHETIPLEKGSYKITRQREYSPEAIRDVAD